MTTNNANSATNKTANGESSPAPIQGSVGIATAIWFVRGKGFGFAKMQTPRGEIIRFHMDDCRRIEPMKSADPALNGQPCLTNKPHNLIPLTREDNGVGDKIVFVLDPECQTDGDKPQTALAWGYENYWQVAPVIAPQPAAVQIQSNPPAQQTKPAKKARSTRRTQPTEPDIDLVTEIEDLTRRNYGSNGEGRKKNGHRPHRAEMEECVR
jgi:hypothetical protein